MYLLYVYINIPALALYVFQISLGKIMHPNTKRTSSLLTDLLLIHEGEPRPVNGLPYSSRESGHVCRKWKTVRPGSGTVRSTKQNKRAEGLMDSVVAPRITNWYHSTLKAIVAH